MRLPFLLLFLCLPALVLAVPVGDEGSHAVRFDNERVYAVSAQVGTQTEGISADVPPFSQLDFIVHCVGEDAPKLHRTSEGNSADLSVPVVAFPDGPPALWISSAHQGRAQLEKSLQTVRSGMHLKHIKIDTVPDSFTALRFAPLILVSASDLAGLSAPKRTAIRLATAAGATLVIGAGGGELPTDLLTALIPVNLGTVGRADPALMRSVNEASGQRSFTFKAPAFARITSNDTPVLVEATLGLGRVRVLGVRLTELRHGPVAKATWQATPDAISGALAWLAAAPPLTEVRSSPLSGTLWGLLAGLVALAFLARWRPREAVLAALVLGTVAAVFPPVKSAHTQDAHRMLMIPVGDTDTLVLGSFDLTMHTQVTPVLPAHSREVALEDTRPGGACAVVTPKGAAVVVRGGLGSRTRITYLMTAVERPEKPADLSAHLPQWPAGPLAGAALYGLPAQAVPTLADTQAQANVDAFWLEPKAVKPPSVVRLDTPTE